MDSRAKLLFVDDDVTLLGVLELYFTRRGYESRTTSTGVEALQQLVAWRPHLVVLDLVMPQMDGWEICERIRGFSSVPIIILSARDDVQDRVTGLRMGADDYIVKPFTIRELEARIAATLRRYQKCQEAAWLSMSHITGVAGNAAS